MSGKFQRRRNDEVQYPPDHQRGRLGEDFDAFHHPLLHVKIVFRRLRHRKRIQECGQHHLHFPWNEFHPRLHKLKLRRFDWNTRRRGNDRVSQLHQVTGRITLRRKGVRSKHLHSSNWLKNHCSSRWTSITTKTNRHGTGTYYDHVKVRDSGRRSTIGRPHQARKSK